MGYPEVGEKLLWLMSCPKLSRKKELKVRRGNVCCSHSCSCLLCLFEKSSFERGGVGDDFSRLFAVHVFFMCEKCSFEG